MGLNLLALVYYCTILTLWWGAGILAKDLTIYMWVFPAQLFEEQVNVVRAFCPQNA